jgi:glycosyltransferase involved in cell wall biosynthesis
VKHICIVTTRHISYNPRVLKEADAFQEAGYKVTVVTVNYQLQPALFDKELMSSRNWTLKTVNFRKEVPSEKMVWFRLSLQQKISALLSKFLIRDGIVSRALNKAYDPLLKMARQTKADLYIVHHPEALRIGWQAAVKYNAKFAFDAEDFHTGMNKSPLSPPDEERQVEYLEKKYLPLCDYITAASAGIARAYASKYDLELPAVVLNVFPKVKLPNVQRRSDVVKFYWFSQVIGPNRNIEYLFQAASVIPLPFEIHLRGDFHNEEYKKALEGLVGELKLHAKVFFHQPILSEQIIPDASSYDVGLALELKDFMNSNLCVSNKTFAYLMAGLAVIGNDTEGQKEIFTHFPDASSLCCLDDVSTLTEAMLKYIENPALLERAKKSARSVALNQFNWERESSKVLHLSDKVLSGKTMIMENL